MVHVRTEINDNAHAELTKQAKLGKISLSRLVARILEEAARKIVE